MKARFVTTNKMKYSIAYTRRNDQGIIVENRDIRFTPGSKRLGKIVPAYYETSNKDEIEYLKEYPNFGFTFKLVDDKEVKKSESTSKKPSPKKEEVKEDDGEDDVNFDDEDFDLEDEAEPKEFQDVTTVQQANIKLRKLDSKLKVTDVNTKDKIKEEAKRLNVSFPNL
jgi:hypothetical protein